MTDSSGESEYTYDYHGRLKTYKPPIGLDFVITWSMITTMSE